MILPCICKANKTGNTAGATFQDEQYGKGNRVFNRLGKEKKTQYRCTICGTVKDIGGAATVGEKTEKKPAKKNDKKPTEEKVEMTRAAKVAPKKKDSDAKARQKK